MTTFILRNNHANEYELQNYYPIAKKYNISLITSHHPLTLTSLQTHQLYSPTDLPKFPFRKQLFNRLIGGEQWLYGLNKLIKMGDIIHSAETYTPYTHQAVELRKRGIISKLVCTCWETIPHNNEKFARFKRWKQEAYQYVDIFHVPTIRAKQALITEGVLSSKIKVIPYGVDLSRFSNLRSHKEKGHKPLILTLARRVPEKGYKIWQEISHQLSSIADFQWISDASYTDVPQILAKSDIFFLPSQTTPTWEEQYGMVLVEAMAAGLPIITTTSGAIPEVVGDVALLSSPTDHLGIENNLVQLISNSNLRNSCTRRSLARAQALYSHLSVSLQLAHLYS